MQFLRVGRTEGRRRLWVDGHGKSDCVVGAGGGGSNNVCYKVSPFCQNPSSLSRTLIFGFQCNQEGHRAKLRLECPLIYTLLIHHGI